MQMMLIGIYFYEVQAYCYLIGVGCFAYSSFGCQLLSLLGHIVEENVGKYLTYFLDVKILYSLNLWSSTFIS